jgi:hypothetical protein
MFLVFQDFVLADASRLGCSTCAVSLGGLLCEESAY